MDLLGNALNSPQMDLALGLLGQSGWHPFAAPTAGEAFAGAAQFANNRQLQRAQLNFRRQQIEDNKRRMDAQNQLVNLLQTPAQNVPEMIRRPGAIEDQQNQLQSLLFQAAPEMAAQSMLAQQPTSPRVSTDFNTFAALNPQLQPGSEEFRTQYLEFVQSQDATGEAERLARLDLLQAQLQEALDDRLQRTETKKQERTALTRSLTQDFSKLKKLADLNDRLRGTALETGLPMAELRRASLGGWQAVQSLIGGDDSQARRLTADFDTFNKLTSDFLIGSLDRLNGSGTVTNAKFQELIAANAGVGSSPETNDFIVASNIRVLLDAATDEGISIQDREELEQLATRLEAGASLPAQLPSTTTPSAAIPLEDYLRSQGVPR